MLLHNLYQRRWASQPDRTKTATAFSAGFDAVVGIGLLATGWYTATPWYIANAAYYLALAWVRAYLLRHLLVQPRNAEPSGEIAAEAATEQSPERNRLRPAETTAFRRAGVLLAIAGLAYFAVAAAMYFAGRVPAYSGLAPYGVASVAFTKAGLGIAGIAAARNSGSPVQLGLRIASLCDALVSMAVTQYALMSLAADPNAATTSASVGMGFAACIAACGVVMVIRPPSGSPASPSGAAGGLLSTVRRQLARLFRFGQADHQTNQKEVDERYRNT